MISKIINSSTVTAIQRMVDEAQHIVLTCHLSPDGDAIGSTTALCRVLANAGKNAVVVVPDQVPRALTFVPGYRNIIAHTLNESRAKAAVEQADLIFCLDFNTLKRIDKLGDVISQSRAPRILIDHHIAPDDVFDQAISFPQASSTCELVYRLLYQMGKLDLIDLMAASSLYVGLMTDTGNFAYSCNNPEVFIIAAQLLAKGINRDKLYALAMNTSSESSLRLNGYAIDKKMRTFPIFYNGQLRTAALITLSAQELEQYNYRKGDTEGLVNKPLSMPGCIWSVFLREDKDIIKVSMRSKGNFAVNEICARYFGGGGHKNASGGETHDSLEQTVAIYQKILKTFDKIKR